jgi:hypothetical protein
MESLSQTNNNNKDIEIQKIKNHTIINDYEEYLEQNQINPELNT